MNKKALILVCVLVVCLMAMALVACSGKYEMNGFVVDFSKLSATYQEGDEVDLSVIKITASFTDDTTETIPLDRVTIVLDGDEITAEQALTKITEKTGEHTLEIKYSDQVKSFKITVTEKHVPVLTKVKLEAADTFNATYNYGQEVNLAGLKVIAVYDEEDEVELSLDDVTLIIDQEEIAEDKNVITNTVGARVLKARYGTMMAENSVTITVNNVFREITFTVPTDLKRTYKVGESVVLSGITAKANYAYGANPDVPAENIKFYLGDNEANLSTLKDTKGVKNLTVKATYDGHTGTLPLAITVENFVSSIAVDVTAVPHLDFVVGDAISAATFANAKVNVTYADPADNTEISITANGVTMTDVSRMTNTPGEKTVTVNYAGKSATFTFTVVPGETAIESLTVESTPYLSQTLTAGDTGISFADLTIKAVYKDEYAKDDEVITFAEFATKGVTLYLNEVELTDLDDVTKVTAEGLTEVTVSVAYEGQFADFKIKVNNGVTGLSAVPATTEYKLHQVPTFDDVEVTATLNYGSKTVDIEDVEFYNGEDKVTDLSVFTNALGSKSVRVKYGAFASFNITVVDFKKGIYTTAESYTTDVSVTPNAKYDFTGKIFWLYESGKNDEAIAAGDLTITNDGITVPTADKTVTISAGGFEKTVKLVVNNVLESIAVYNVPTLYLNTDVNFLGLYVVGTYRYGGDSQVIITDAEGKDFILGVSFAWKATAEGEYNAIVLDQLTNLNVIATTADKHYVKLTYTENGKAVSGEFEVTVETLSTSITGFEAPTSVTKYAEAKSTAASTTDTTSKDFEGSFFVSDEQYYLVGNDNPYKFLPIATTTDIMSETSATYASYKADSKIYMDGEELTDVVVDKKAATKTYKIGEVEYVVEYYNRNEYQFTETAIDHVFKLSVLPDTSVIPNADQYDRVEQTFKVIDGFNVTDPRQLCLLEQTTTRHYWDVIKGETGLSGVKPKAIILHDNMRVTTASIPESFYYTLDPNSDKFKILYYYEDGEGKHTVAPEDVPEALGGPQNRTFLYEGEYGIFRYDMGVGDSFKIYGNYFDIDLSHMPRVAAFEPSVSVQIPAGFSGTYYGQYQSKVSFLVVYGVEGSNAESFEFKDFAVKGNAHMDLLRVSEESSIEQGAGNLVYAGSLIFVKVWNSVSHITNLNAHNCFIPYFSYGGTDMTYTNCKAYDSFQCALFINKNSVNHLTKCHWKRANGPLILMCQDWDEEGGNIVLRKVPEMYADDTCVLESIVTAESSWFAQNGQTENVKNLAAMDQLLQGYFHKTLFGTPGTFNVIAVSIAENWSQSPETQSFIQYGNCFVDRLPGKATASTLFNHPQYGPVPVDLFNIAKNFLAADSATFTVGNNFCAVGFDASNPAYASALGYYLMDLNQQNVAMNDGVVAAFEGSDYQYVGICKGPMGILAELYPLS